MYKGDPALVTYWKRWKRKIYFVSFLYFFVYQPVWNALISFFQAEVTEGLSVAYKYQQAYYAANGKWCDDYSDLLVDFDERGKYAYFFSPTEVRGRSPASLGLGSVDFAALGAPEPGVYEDGFVIVAIGNIDLDPEPDVWWIDQDLVLHNPRSDAWNFWKWVLVAMGWGDKVEV